MANTLIKTGKIINITAMDSDFNLATSYPDAVNPRGECRVKRIAYEGNAADKMVVRNGADTAAVICTLTVTAEAPTPSIDFDGEGLLCKPHIDLTDCTTAGTERVIIILA